MSSGSGEVRHMSESLHSSREQHSLSAQSMRPSVEKQSSKNNYIMRNATNCTMQQKIISYATACTVCAPSVLSGE